MKTISCGHKLLLCLLLLLAPHALKATDGLQPLLDESFAMGNSIPSDADITDAPIRTVTLNRFYVGKCEVTKAEWDEVRNWGLSHGYTDLAMGSGKASSHPVHSISWYDAVKWCNARSEKEGLTPVYYTDDALTTIYKTGLVDVTNEQVKWTANGYRLPTEAEWECAARGGRTWRFGGFSLISHYFANYYGQKALLPHYDFSDGYNPIGSAGGTQPATSPVGSFPANDFGLYDMVGNVSEWCWDHYWTYAPGSQTNPHGDTPDFFTGRRVTRGGNWGSDASYCRVAFRGFEYQHAEVASLGLRIVRDARTFNRIYEFHPRISNKNLDDVPFTVVVPTSTSKLPVTLSVKSGPATISGNTVTITGAGIVVLAANQVGDTKFLPASEVTTSFTVSRWAQTIGAFSPISAKTFGDSAFAVTPPTSSSKLPVSLSVKSGPATISDNTVTIIGAGTVVLAANQAGTAGYMPATEVTTSFTVAKGAQTIAAFSPIADKTFDSVPFAVVSPTSSSKLPVTLSIKSGPATISGNTVTMTGLGTVLVGANQAGNADYLPATEVTTSFTVAKGLQTISAFNPIVGKVFGNAPFAVVSPTSSSKLPVTLSVKSGPATISGNTVTITGAGIVVLAANQVGDTKYLPASEVTTSFTVSRWAQTIGAFSPISAKTFGDSAFAVTPPTSSSNLPVKLSIKSGPATIYNNIVTLTGAGAVVIAANQTGNDNYNATTEVTTSFTVLKATQTIDAIASVGNKTFGDASFAVTAPSASSALPVTLSVKSGPAIILGNTVTLTGAGTVVLAANQAGNDNYNAATEVTTSITVSKDSQTIAAFASIGNKTFGDASFAVTAPTASSSLPVTLSVKSGPASISGNSVTLTGAGTVVIAANQAGNDNYNAAAEVTTSFSVSQAAQTIGAFTSIGNKAFGDAPFAVTAPTSSSSLPVTLSVKSGPATISGNSITITGVGNVVVAANQAGNANYSPAAEVTTSFTVAKASQIVNFPPVGDLLLSRSAITLSANASSGLPVGFSVISGPATINGSFVTLIGSGRVTMRASQAGNENYLPASTLTTFNIKPNTSAPTLISLSKNWFYYNAQPNTVVANLSAADPDPGDRVSYRLVSGTGSKDNNKFTLLDGVLRTATNFDLNIQRSASVRIRTSDLLGQYRDQIFELTLVDPNPWAAFELKAPPFTESPSYVNVVFQLRDENRRRINLPQELLDQSGGWFVVSEDGKQISSKESILQVARNEVPLKVRTVLLLDNSNSVGADLETIKSAAKTFVDRMFQTQEIAIYSFSGGSPNLVKNFTAKSAAGQKALKSAIDGIKLGSPSTNLYGSVLAMLQLPKWKESFTLAGIETGCLVVMTDGSDTAGLATLSAAIQKRNSDKKQIFAVGLGADIDPAALNSLQNGDASYTPVLNPTQLAAAFAKIQSIIEDGANNFYWLNYASPKRGNINRKLTIALKNNINGAANRMINTLFNSNGFFDITPGVVINRRVNVASGVESLSLHKNAKITANAFTMLGYKGVPVYTWSVGNAALASVVPIGSDGAQANILSKGLDGTTKLTLRDKVNGFSKTIDLIIGTGVAPVSKSANVVQSAQLSSPATQESVAMMDISSLSEATPSLAGSSPKVSDTLKSKESFSRIPAGSFTMGDSLDGISDAPRRTVALDAYYIGKYEVTKVEWDEVRTWALSNGYTDLAAGSGKASNHPVQTISWYDMVKWCNARSQKEGLSPVYYINNAHTTVYKTGNVDVTNAQVKWSANGYRLPTEAEWEKAARGGLSGKRFPWGNTISHSRANYYATSDYKYDLTGNSYHHPSYKTGSEPYTSPVGAFAANGYGLYDMAGNVFEWCWDWHVKYASGSQTNPRGATLGTHRVGRGGGWYIGAEECRVAYRDSGIPADWDSGVGFRVARSLPAGPPQITSDLSKVILTKGKSTAPYAVLTNFLAKNFSASNLPPGLRLQANGVISGTPTKSGTYNVMIVAKKIQDGKVVKSAKATKIFEVK
jgi:formylglycine-generating enzyme required for sulfatase activity